jgi:hypothetical protein
MASSQGPTLLMDPVTSILSKHYANSSLSRRKRGVLAMI